MFVMTAVGALCALVLVASLMAVACRHRPDLWITSHDAILCIVSPVLILLLTFGGVALGYRLTHGGLAAVAAEAWTGSAAIVATAVVLGQFVARRLRRGRPVS